MAGRADVMAGGAFVRLLLKDDMTKALQRSLANAGKAMQNFGANVTRAGVGVSAAGAAMLAPVVAGVKAFAQFGDALDKMSQRTGIAAGELAAYGFAMEQSGSDLETFEKDVRKMQQSIGDLGQGLGTAVDAFGALGISLADLEGLSPDQQFDLIARRISAIEDPTEKAAAAMEIFGARGGTALLPMLGDLEALKQEARDLGIVPSEEEVKKAAAVTDAINRVRRVVKGMFFDIGAAMADNVLDWLETVKDVGIRIGNWVKANGPLIVVFAKVAAGVAAAGAAIVVLGSIISGIGSVLAGLAVVVGLVLSPVGLLTAALVAGFTAWLKYTESGQAALAALKNIFGGIGDALALGDLGLAGEIAMAGLQEAFWTGMAAILDRWGAWVKPLVEIFAGAMGAVQAAFVRVSGFISDQLLKLAGQEGAMGEAARTVLGIDPRQSSAEAKLMKQEIEAVTTSRKALEKGIADYEAGGGTGMVSQGAFGRELTYEEALQRRKDLQERLRNAGARAGGLGAAGVNEAREMNEELTKQALADVEANVAELLNAYAGLAAGGAAGKAEELAKKRRELIEEAERRAIEKDMLAQTNAYAADFESAMGGGGAGGGGEGAPTGAKGAVASGIATYSAAAAQAAGQMGGSSPQAKMASDIERMRIALVEAGAISKDAHLSNKQMIKTHERWMAALHFT